MKKNGFQFLVDANGDKTAVLIDLKKHRQLWEDFYDLTIIESRREEPRVDWQTIRKRLLKKIRRHA
jgi:hypothetical protein